MVRTRKARDVLQSAGSCYDGLRARESRSAVKDADEQGDDSDETEYVPTGKRRKLERRVSSRINKKVNSMGPSDNYNSTNDGTNCRVTRLRSQRRMGHEEEDSRETNSSQNDALGGAIRRSTRQRKLTYDTLNQGWLLGHTRIRDYALLEDVVVERRVSRSKKQQTIEVEENDDDDDEEEEEGEEERGDNASPYKEDMYSRIKRDRAKRVQTYYGMDPIKKKDHVTEDESSDFESEEEEEEGPEVEAGESTEESGMEIPNHVHPTKYYLRQKKPIIDRFQVSLEPTRHRKTSNSLFHAAPTRRHFRRDLSKTFLSPAHKSPLFRPKRRHATHNSSTSSSSSSSDNERRFERRKSKSMAKARNRCLPMNFNPEDITNNQVLKNRNTIGSSLADVDPMNVDKTTTFESIGGLNKHIEALKEMLLLPLMYPEVFDRFKITPPRGVLFYGPPGTGKTLVARALANECSQGERKVAFFMRKGADCLSKWVGESERQLRLLFDQAYSMRPSIVFFDEIDGLAPVRSTRQDQIHSSIVSTLLALMDGLDNRGEVVVIGATNRIDAIDPALRRPGRFDREFHFPLPSIDGRRTILKIHTKEWNPALPDDLLEELAQKTVGYCGADVKALCAEAAFLALRRQFPEIYHSKQKLLLDVSNVKIESKDFAKAIAGIVPAAQRMTITASRPLSLLVQPLLQNILSTTLESLKLTFPQGFKPDPRGPWEDAGSRENVNEAVGLDDLINSSDEGEDDDVNTVSNGPKQNCPKRIDYAASHRPRFLLTGYRGQGQSTHLAPAVLHKLERFPVHKLDLPALYAVTAKSPEESCAQIFIEAQRILPSILYLPHVGQWWETLSDTVRATFLTLLHDLNPTAPLLLLATSDHPYEELPLDVQALFDPHHGEVFCMPNPGREERRQFFTPLIMRETRRRPKRKRRAQKHRTPLPVAPPPEPRTLSEAELRRLEEQEESTLRELRLFLREILYKLARDRRFIIFSKPVDTSEVPDYLQVIHEPMDLETMMTKVDLHKYLAASDFLADVDLICHNALEYNPDRDPSDKIIRHRACALKDAAHALVMADLDPEFEQMCQEVKESRRMRGSSPSKYAPKHYITTPKVAAVNQEPQTPQSSAARGGLTATPPGVFSISPSSAISASSGCRLGEGSSKRRCSRRVRGLDAPKCNFSAHSDEEGDSGKRKRGPRRDSVQQPRNCPYKSLLFRRKKSPWFGARRRRVFRSVKALADSDDEVIRDNAAGSGNHLLNGESAHILENDGSMAEFGLNMLTKKRERRNGDIIAEDDLSKKVHLSSDEGSESRIAINKITVNPVELLGELDSSKMSLGLSPSPEETTIEDDENHEKPDVVVQEENVKASPVTDVNTKRESPIEESREEPEVTAAAEISKSAHDGNTENQKVTNVTLELVNGVSSPETVEASASAKAISDEDKEEEPEEAYQAVEIDERRLEALLESIVRKTEGCVVEILEKFHCRLSRRVAAHRQHYDRTALLSCF